MRPQKEPSQELIEKYYGVLIKLQKQLKSNPYIRTSAFAKDNNIGIIFVTVVKKSGIIKSLNEGNKRDPAHEWSTIDPTRQMAVKVIKTMNSTTRENKHRYKALKEAEAAEEKLKEEKLAEETRAEQTAEETTEEVTREEKKENIKEKIVTEKAKPEPMEVFQEQEIVRYLPMINEDLNIKDNAPKENSFAFYLFGIPLFKIKKVS